MWSETCAAVPTVWGGDLHPWNNDGRQIGTSPTAQHRLHRVPGHLTAYNRIPTTAMGGRPTAMLQSNAYGRGL